MFNSTNGLVLPGGGRDLLKSGERMDTLFICYDMNHIHLHCISHSTTGYAKGAKILWDLALKSGDYPIIGFCLGFNIMATLSNNNGAEK